MKKIKIYWPTVLFFVLISTLNSCNYNVSNNSNVTDELKKTIDEISVNTTYYNSENIDKIKIK